MLTKSHAVLMAVVCAGLVVGATVWGSVAPAAAATRMAFDSRVWVGSSTSSQIAGQVRPDLQLGINFGVDLTADEDISALGDILLSLDLTKTAGVAVVTGLTAGCDAAPTLITCKVSPSDKATQFQSMTLTAAPGAASDATGSITLLSSWPGDANTSNDVGTLDLSVDAPIASEQIAPADATKPPTAAVPSTSPPVVIEPLPAVGSRAQNPPATPKPGVTLTASMAKVPNAISTRQPGIVQTAEDGTRYVENAGGAPAAETTPWGSPVFLIALGASSMGLLALFIFGVVNARRAMRPSRPVGTLWVDDPTRPDHHIRQHK